MPKLIILKDGKEARSFTLEADLVQIGSAEGNTIRIKSPQISREHCEIRRSGMQFRLVDLESKNGTKVNGTFVNQHLLEEGDRIELGAIVLEFRRNGAAPAVSRAAPVAAAAPAARRAPAARSGPAPGRRTGPVRDRRPPPPASSSNTTLLAILGGGAALVLIVVAAFVLSSDDGQSKVGPDEDAAPLDTTSPDTGAGRREARAEIDRLVMRAGQARSDEAATLLSEIDAALSRYADTLPSTELGRLRAAREMLVSGGATGGATGSLHARFEATEKEAYALQDKLKYGAALALWESFFEKNADLVTGQVARMTFEPKVEKKIYYIKEIVRSRWDKIQDRCRKFVKEGKPERAIKLIEQQIGAWDMPEYTKLGEAEIEKIRAGM